MSKFLEQEKANRARRKTDNMSMKEILVVKNVRTKNTPGSDEFTDEFYQTLKEKVMPVLQNFHTNSSKALNRRDRFPTHSMRSALHY